MEPELGPSSVLASSLPPPLPVFAQYEPCRRSGSHLYVSGQVAAYGQELLHTGRVGAEVSVADAEACARQCAMNVLALLRRELTDLRRVRALVMVTVYIASAPDFVQQHIVADSASEVFIEYLGERGRHARSAIGVTRLPMDSPIEIEAVVLLQDDLNDARGSDGGGRAAARDHH